MVYTLRITLIFLGIIIGIETFHEIPIEYTDKFLEFIVYILTGGILWEMAKEEPLW